MIDLTAEEPISLNQAARLLPPGRGGRPVSFNCILRWVLDGARAPHGGIVRLEACRMGARWLTSRQALQRFAERLTPLPGEDREKPPRTSKQRRSASEHAESKLQEMGL